MFFESTNVCLVLSLDDSLSCCAEVKLFVILSCVLERYAVSHLAMVCDSTQIKRFADALNVPLREVSTQPRTFSDIEFVYFSIKPCMFFRIIQFILSYPSLKIARSIFRYNRFVQSNSKDTGALGPFKCLLTSEYGVVVLSSSNLTN